MTEPCPRDLSQQDGHLVLGHTMAGPLCLVLLSASLACLPLPGGSGKCPSPGTLWRWRPRRRRNPGDQGQAPKSP